MPFDQTETEQQTEQRTRKRPNKLLLLTSRLPISIVSSPALVGVCGLEGDPSLAPSFFGVMARRCRNLPLFFCLTFATESLSTSCCAGGVCSSPPGERRRLEKRDFQPLAEVVVGMVRSERGAPMGNRRFNGKQESGYCS